MKTIVGEKYIVPVVTVIAGGVPVEYVIIDNLHGDKENGQPYRHYHVDTRFESGGYELRLDEHRITSKKYVERIATGTCAGLGTGVDFLVNTKLKRRCLSKHKLCPHKGYDLSDTEPNENGEIQCPLHNLRFDAKTGVMIEAHQKFFDRKIMMDKIFPEFSEKDRNLGVILGYEFPYISPTIKNYEERKLELLALRKEREKNEK